MELSQSRVCLLLHSYAAARKSALEAHQFGFCLSTQSFLPTRPAAPL